MWRRLSRAWRLVAGRSRLQDEMTDEMRFHLEARAADLAARGVAPDEARRQAHLEFGSVEAYKEEARQTAGLRLLSDWRSDLVYATRLIRRQPGFAAVAILSLALGIGANAFVFSVVDALVLRPLPVDRPGELAFVETHTGSTVSFPAYRDLRDRNDTLAGAIGYRMAPMNLEQRGAVARVWGYLATGNYFDVLGVTPAAGRFFHQNEDQPPAPSPLAVLSYDCWIRRFAGDPGAVGSTIHINGLPYTVIGVAPRGFVGTEIFYRPDVWVPMTMEPQVEARVSWLDNRRTMNTWMIVRLRPGVTRAQAESNLNAIAASLAREYPQSDDGLAFRLARPGLVGNALRTPVRAFTLGVLLLAGLVLLMACVNLAVMLAARGADRRRELAIRLSIGADTGRLVRQLLTETLLLSLMGGAAGLALAFIAARALSAWHLPVEVPVQFDLTPDLLVFLFALAVATASGLLFGLAPARQAARTDANAALKGLDQRAAGRRRWAFRDLLVTVQVALCFVLMAGCLLALRGLQQAVSMPLGFAPQGVTVVGFDLGLAGYSDARGAAFERQAVDAVRRLPGIDGAAYSDTLPLNIDQDTNDVMPDDQPDLPPSKRIEVSRFRVSPDFFRTMGARLVQGRAIETRDVAGAPPVAVINETFARLVLRTSHPIGRRFREGLTGAWIEVVGEVEDGKYQSLTEAPRPAVFEAVAQQYSSTITLVAKSSRPPGQVIADIKSAIGRLDPRLALYETESLDDMLGTVLFPSRVAAVALGAFGVLALLLAVTGLHGVVSNSVARRRKEIGVRLAVGARPVQVLRLILARTVVLLGVGALAGAALVLLGGQVLASVVYEASPRDPVVFAAVGVGLLVLGAASCWAPARRALGVSPVSALRTE
jgi:predicted permease